MPRNPFANLLQLLKAMSLTRKFALLSILCLMALALGLASLLSWYIENRSVNSHKHLIAQAIRAHITSNFVPEDLEIPKYGSEWERFEKKLGTVLSLDGNVRTKIYNKRKVIIWSDERNLVGQQFSHNPELDEALNGSVEAEITDLKKEEHEFERPKFRRLMELYVPIKYPGQPEVVALAEAYFDVDKLYAEIASGKRLIYGITFGSLGILFLVLLGIVRQASGTIVRHAEELTLLLNTIRAVSATLDLSQVLAEVAKENVRHIKVTFCQIFLLEDNDSILVRNAVHPVRTGEWSLELGQAFSLSDCSMLHRVLLSEEPSVIRLDKSVQTLSPEETKALPGLHIKYVVLVPMVSKGRVIGLLALGESRSWQREPFTQEKMGLCIGMAEQAAVAVENARLFVQLEDSYNVTLYALVSALDARERETRNHSQRVAAITAFLTRKMGADEDAIHTARQGALLHDIGKIGVSDSILLKPGKLTPSEWAAMKKHPYIGYSILKGVKFLSSAKEVVLYHHEHFDGNGYPQGLKGQAIPLGARIFTLVDALDAMINDRPYRPARSLFRS